MTIEQAIKKSIEGGYCGPQRTFLRIHPSPWENDTVDYFDFWTGCTFLEPSFWQSLGKALVPPSKIKGTNVFDASGWNVMQANGKWYWQDVWHRFIDHLADGKSAEEFFEKLL